MIKKLLKYTFIFTLSMFIAGILFVITLSGVAMSLLMPDSQSITLEKNAVLEIQVNGVLSERKTESPLDMLLGENDTPTQSLEELLEAIKEAQTNANIRAIYLRGGLLYAEPATMEELRRGLTAFKASGKPIVAYADTYSQGSYYVCSVADTLLLNPNGQIDWHGLAAEPVFYKDLLSKFGIRMEVFKVGRYKSAVEPFTSTQMSEANKEQVASYLGTIWKHMLKEVSATRKLSADSLQRYADDYTVLLPSKELVSRHMADRLTYTDEARTLLKRAIGKKADAKLQMVSPGQLAASIQPAGGTGKGEIAVYYAYGDIISSPLADFSSEDAICAPEVTQDLEELAEDEKVKAVVLRINSGGGSAYASEQIWHSVALLRKKKPVVVSMGGMAASGGYYMGCGANYLMAEPTTLTGSIGIFGLVPDASELLTDKLGLHFDEVKTNRHATFGTPSRPMDASERQLMQQYIERGYDLFITRVAEGRRMPKDKVETLAAGRVWTGTQAKANGLIDGLGTLDDAVAKAARFGNVKEYSTVHYPRPTAWYESLLSEGRTHYMEGQMKQVLGEYYCPLRFLKSVSAQDRLQARILYQPNIH